MGMIFRRTTVGLVCTWFFLVGLAWGDEPKVDVGSIIERARAAIASEEVLNELDSLYFEGVLELYQNNIRGAVRVFLQKPAFQRIEVETEAFLKVTIIGEDLGWEILTNKQAEDAVPKRRLLTPEEYWENRYNAVENLYFYHGYKRERGQLVFLEQTFLEGIEVDVFQVTFDQKNIHQRMISVDTGELVASKAPDGTLVFARERETIDGIKLPKEVEYYSDGKRVSRVRFNKIEVNPWLDSALFRVPVFR
jgi:hypothetical protein|tara:strand:- start:2665 stop:3414 length:750 start_codon:yes stop_codon:yes gene_type:complete